MRFLKFSFGLILIAGLGLSGCKSKNGMHKRMKNKSKKKCDCPGWTQEKPVNNYWI
jgi:hypothetical protein